MKHAIISAFISAVVAFAMVEYLSEHQAGTHARSLLDGNGSSTRQDTGRESQQGGLADLMSRIAEIDRHVSDLKLEQARLGRRVMISAEEKHLLDAGLDFETSDDFRNMEVDVEELEAAQAYANRVEDLESKFSTDAFDSQWADGMRSSFADLEGKLRELSVDGVSLEHSECKASICKLVVVHRETANLLPILPAAITFGERDAVELGEQTLVGGKAGYVATTAYIAHE